MSCQTVRQQLLASERPDQPAAEQASHLTGCADCRVWLRRLARLEQQLPLIPVPASAPPAALLEMLRAAPANAIVRTPVLLHPVRPRREGARQKLALAFSLAATLALFALGWWAWPLLESPRMIHDAQVAKRLETARTSQEKVIVLGKMADEYFNKARSNPDDRALLEDMARRFQWVVLEDLLQHAREVPPKDRGFLKGVAKDLERIESDAARQAADWRDTHASAAVSINQIATAAREAERRLSKLIPA